jgi:purine-binding chemotaxis protein CheW
MGIGQYLTFFLGGEEYAVPILRVREVVAYAPPTRVPGVPACIRGVINLHGTVVPLIDLSIKFGHGETRVTRLACIVIVEIELDGEATIMGVLVDEVSQVMELQPGDVEPPPPFGTRVRVEYLVGMVKKGERFALLLDVDRVLSNQELEATLEAQRSEPTAQQELER